MIPVSAYYPQYHQPSEPLMWAADPRGLSEDAKILAILEILRGLRMTPTDLLLQSISQKPAMMFTYIP
jgi:hypothetical protein